jgi:CelD/BcsL family acetyltransferase involved in cellulose biosynthesis
VSELRWYRLEDRGLRSDWEELATATSAGPFMRVGWFDAWTRAFGGKDIEVAGVGDGGIAALMPLQRTRDAVRAPVNEHSPEYQPVSHSTAASRLAAAVMREGPRAVEVLKTDGVTARVWQAAADETGYRVVSEVMQRSPFLETASDWDAYERSLSSSFRQGLRRKKRRLEDEGRVSIEVHDGREALEPLLSEGFAVESSQWKADEGTAIESDPKTEAFYTDVARWAADRDWLKLVFLRLDGDAVAFRMDLVCDGAYYHLKGGYHPRWARFSPGLVLQHETVRHAFEAGLSRYEFLGADEPYKMNWTKTVTERSALRCFAPTFRGRAAWAKRAWAAPLGRTVRHLMSRTRG